MVPRMMPVGRVMTDKSKTDGLVAAYVMSPINMNYGGSTGAVGTRDVHSSGLDLLAYSNAAVPTQLPDGIYFPAPGSSQNCRLNHPNAAATQFYMSYLSIQVRIRRDDLGAHRRIFSWGSDTLSTRYDAYLSANNAVYFDFYDSGGTLRDIYSGLTVPVGWNDIAIIYDGSNVTFIVNNSVAVVSASYGAMKTTSGSNYFVIGAYLNFDIHQFLGVMSHFFIWNKALPVSCLLSYCRDPYQFLIPT
jgi:hypothetical protein